MSDQNGMVVYGAGKAIVTKERTDYLVSSPFGNGSLLLKRDVDFGVVPKTKKPSLYKSGAEKVCMAYGLMQRYYMESKQEVCGENPFFYYLVRCDLVKIVDGKEYVFTSGYGSANTGESRNGFSGAYNAANNCVKMAQKRALVSAALSVSGVSDMFTQDIENEDFMKKAEAITEEKPTDPITRKQISRIFAIAAENGYNTQQAKQKIIALGYASTKDIKQQDYDAVCAAFEDNAK